MPVGTSCRFPAERPGGERGSAGIGPRAAGDFLNGELWGKVTAVSWAVIFFKTGGGNYPRHPSQLYEAALEGFVLLGVMQWRFWRSQAIRQQAGRLSGEFLLAYAMVRMVCEQFREPDAALICGLSRGSFYSLFLAAGGLALIISRAGKTSKRES